MSVSVIVPLAADSDERIRNWAWLEARYRALHPSWQLVVSNPGTGVPGSGWSKGAAVNAGLELADGDVLVVADADVLADAPDLERATEVALEAPWVVPFWDVYRLSKDETVRVVSDEPPAAVVTTEVVERRRLDPVRLSYRGKPGGGMVVAHRGAFDVIGGMDERFVGWGGEDFALAHALTACVGRPERLTAPLWHLWHPPQLEYDPSGKLPEANRALLKRYRRAVNDAGTMRALLEERTGGDHVGCGCGGTERTPEQAAALRLEAKCLTCGLSFTSYGGEDGAESHKATTGHVIEGLRGLRAATRRSEADVVLDPFAASNP